MIADHEGTVIPERILRHVNRFIESTLKSEEEYSSWICEDDKIVSQLVLTDRELSGSGVYKNCPKPQTANGRKIIGVNIPSEEPAWHSRYSVILTDEVLDEIFHRVFSRIPEELFPDKGETADSMIRKISGAKYLDVIYSWFNDVPLNENPSSMQPVRRTSGMVKKRAHFFHPQLPAGEEEGEGRSVITIYGYPNPECPTNLWMCFPMTKLDYAQGLKVWTKAWPCLTAVSRKTPPNGVQFLGYHRVLNRKMNKHRDNHGGRIILNLVNGEEVPWGENPTVGGSENSQVRGSSVMIFTRGRPMTMTLSYASPDREVTQQTRYYITSPSFQMRMGDGWITVLDVIDDMLMVHSVDWDDRDDEASETDVRFAWVYRWLQVTHDYYTQGCTVRRTKEMMKTCKRDIDETNRDLEREMV